MNEFKLKRGFREIFGTSPYAFLLQHKLELARNYLLDTEWSIGEIARRIGYRDPAHFTHAFRKQYGLRPSDLR
jgi:AraC family transcriptional regulator, transcriptional activator of the genes for pyochelin and ferripyochelin receptors